MIGVHDDRDEDFEDDLEDDLEDDKRSKKLDIIRKLFKSVASTPRIYT